MKKIIKGILSLMLVAIVFISNGMKVNATATSGDIVGGKYVAGTYYAMHSKGTHNMWFQAQFLQRSKDGAFVYCVQPFVTVKEDNTYQVTTEDIAAVLNISQATWSEISKIAYYGYQYTDAAHDHTAEKWYIATQMLIWNKVDPSVDSYFTKTLKGERDDSILRAEQNEIMALVNSHTVKPLFNNMPTEMIIGETITLTDTNNVLSNYALENVKGAQVTKSGNTLIIKATEVGDISFNLNKMGNRYGNAVELYYAVDSQNVMHRGNIDPIKIANKIKVYGGKVTVNKTDNDTKEQVPQGEASLGGAVYEIYKDDGTKVGSITTDTNGNATSDYLPVLGKFYLLEEKASSGYELDKNKHYFEVTTNDLNPQVQVFEQVIKTKFDFIKVYANDKTGVMSPEPNVQFEIYNNKNELVQSVVTNEEGNITFSLPYGTYTVKQITTTQGFEKVNDFELKVTETKIEKKVISNAEITAKLKVIKIDKDTKEVIKRSGIKFEIISSKTNERVCQKVTYPKNTTYCEFETDEDGVLITPYPLNSGTYYLKELDQKIDGYLWNNKSVEFTIDENSKLITSEEEGILFEVKFDNKEVKGNVKVKKNGELLEKLEDGFHYSKINLEGVKIGLYANEDIKSANGVKKYSKDELIGEYLTDKEGNIDISELYLGKYYLKEIETIGEHVLEDKKYEFELVYKDQYTDTIKYELTINNHLSKGTLEFTKSDFSTSETLPNTLIEIYTENDELIFSGRTDEEGKIVIQELPIGKYYILEKEAPEGYTLNDEKMNFEIKEDGEIIKCNMLDEKIVVDVPNTNAVNYGVPISIVLLVGSAGVIVYEIIKDKKRK